MGVPDERAGDLGDFNVVGGVDVCDERWRPGFVDFLENRGNVDDGLSGHGG